MCEPASRSHFCEPRTSFCEPLCEPVFSCHDFTFSFVSHFFNVFLLEIFKKALVIKSERTRLHRLNLTLKYVIIGTLDFGSYSKQSNYHIHVYCVDILTELQVRSHCMPTCK